MYPIVFTIIFTFMMASLIAMMLVVLNLTCTAKAGNVQQFEWICRPAKTKPAYIKIGNEVIDTTPYKMLLVKGWSMHKYDIKDGQRILMHQFRDSEVNDIVQYPVIVFSISSCKFWESRYKLRKFVCYVDDITSASWDTIYDTQKERIDMDKEKFISMCKSKVSNIKRYKLKNRYILSETFDSCSKSNRYSLHRVSSVRGRVEYVLK